MDAEVLHVKLRKECGKRRNRRLRAAGMVPAVLYGHGEGSVSLSAPTTEIEAAIRHGAKLLDLSGDLNESALLKEVHWDAFGIEVLHVDLTRVSATERVEVEIPLETYGVAPGVSAGGSVEILVHMVTLECPAQAIPEKIEVNINHLELNGAVTVADLEIPESAKVLGLEPEEPVVQCVEITAPEPEEEELAPTGEAAEPEVIGARADEEEGGESPES